MRKKFVGMMFIFIFLFSFVLANNNNFNMEFEEAKNIINQNIVCNELSNNQLEVLGEYYMELMMPGELHKIADARMGGEGSESLSLAHINIGKMQYCGEFNGMGGVGYGMMRGINYGMYGENIQANSVYRQSMYGSNNGYGFFWWSFYGLIIIGLILIVVYLSKKGGKGNG